jgi:membrane-associated phospholipid phosphatase
VVVLVLSLAFSARAAAAPASQPSPGLTVDWRIDAPVTGGLAVALFATELEVGKLGPSRCRWCQSNAFDSAARDLRWGSPGAANTISDVTLFLTPALMVGLLGIDAYPAGGIRRWADDTLIAAEATALAGVLTQAVKFTSARQRPFVRALPPAERSQTSDPADNNVSFWSGHTSITFAVATAAGTIATLRRYRHAPYVWAAGMALAAFTGYLRIAADKHYATDVLTSAAVGAACGWGVSYLHYRLRW